MSKQAKALQNQYNGILNLLPVPQRPWINIKIDFAISLPECEPKNAMFTVMDQLPKNACTYHVWVKMKQ